MTNDFTGYARMTHQIIIDGLLACLAVALLKFRLLKGMGDVKRARVESAVLVAPVPGVMVVVRPGRSSAGIPMEIALGRIRSRR